MQIIEWVAVLHYFKRKTLMKKQGRNNSKHRYYSFSDCFLIVLSKKTRKKYFWPKIIFFFKIHILVQPHGNRMNLKTFLMNHKTFLLRKFYDSLKKFYDSLEKFYESLTPNLTKLKSDHQNFKKYEFSYSIISGLYHEPYNTILVGPFFVLFFFFVKWETNKVCSSFKSCCLMLSVLKQSNALKLWLYAQIKNRLIKSKIYYMKYV